MKAKKNDMFMQNRIFIWIAIATGIILLIPLIAMRFTSEVKWDETDFIVIGVLLFTTASLFVLASRMIKKTLHRIEIGIALLLGLVYIWAELAVGIFTNLGS